MRTIHDKKIMTVAFLRRDGELLLAMKKRGFGEGMWNGYGGKMTPEDANIASAAQREIQEESGCKASIQPRGIILFDEPETEKLIEMHVFHIEDVDSEPKETEEMRPQWFPLDALPYDAMWPGDKIWLPHFLAGQRFYGYVEYGPSHELLRRDFYVEKEDLQKEYLSFLETL